MGEGLRQTGIWADALEIPDALDRTLAASVGFDETAALLSGDDIRRIIATGNGASFYVAHALWLTALLTPRHLSAPNVVAVPAGLVARGRFGFKPGDLLIAISSSGELRDITEAVRQRTPDRYVAITSNPESTIAAGAAATAVVHVISQRAVTHTQAFCGNLAAALAVWARVTRDEGLLNGLHVASREVGNVLLEAEAFASSAAALVPRIPRAALVFGSGPVWAAALEGALLLKEVAGIPAEGTETREGATSGMFALAPTDLVLSLAVGEDDLIGEAEGTCRTTGASVIRCSSGNLIDPRLAVLTLFPTILALSVELGLRNGMSVDLPAWLEAYQATARLR